jgi:membrane fusion protein (multidrug efflux system)
VVTLSNIRPGTLVRPGQLLGEFISAGMYELETSISIRFLPFIKEGNVVQLHSNDVPGNWKGTIKRINKKIDESTQTINLYITVNANDLREGMYMEGTLEGITVEDALAVPRRLLIDNNHLFIVQHDSVLEKKAVSILEYTEEEAIIRGLDDGLRLVKDIIPGAFSGMIVRENKQEKTN